MRDETAENGASGVFPALLSNRSCGLFRISPPTEEGLSLSAYASDPALIDEILLRACDRGADILLAPAPVDTADGESDAAFDEPLPSSGVSAFSDELERVSNYYNNQFLYPDGVDGSAGPPDASSSVSVTETSTVVSDAVSG